MKFLFAITIISKTVKISIREETIIYLSTADEKYITLHMVSASLDVIRFSSAA
jgi:hypothetical protein